MIKTAGDMKMYSGCFFTPARIRLLDREGGLEKRTLPVLAERLFCRKQHCRCWQIICFSGNSIAGVDKSAGLQKTALLDFYRHGAFRKTTLLDFHRTVLPRKTTLPFRRHFYTRMACSPKIHCLGAMLKFGKCLFCVKNHEFPF